MLKGDTDALCIIEFPTDTNDEAVKFVTRTVSRSKLNCVTVKLNQPIHHHSSDPEFHGKRHVDLSSTALKHTTSVSQSSLSDTSQQICLYVTCDTSRLLEIADYMDMKKRCADGTMQVFCVDNLDCFENSENLSSFFTTAEKQRLILHELESIKVPDDGLVIPGSPKVKLGKGSSIIKQCLHRGIISQILPLHDSDLEKLENVWYKSKSPTANQPIEQIRAYFGETIAIYFAFLEFYSVALILPALVGVVYYMFNLHKSTLYALIIFAIFNLIWSTAFLETWKRRSNSLTYIWGTNDIKSIEEARPNYHGVMGKNPVTGKEEPIYPKWKRLVRFYFVSFPSIIFCLCIALAAMVLYIECENRTVVWYNSLDEVSYYQEAVSYLPTVVYSVAIILMNQMYRPLAITLNELENHRLQSTFDNHLTLKLVLFWFINTFMLMFYTAFIQQDLVALRKTVLTELIVTQAVDQLQETVVPYVMYKYRKRSLNKDTSDDISKKLKQAKKDAYEGTFDDYLELFIQFGYVTLFSCVSPLAAFLSFINNMIELRTDAIKLCRVHQRPFSLPASGIGAWQLVFELMGYLAIITNSALIGLCIYKAHMLPNISDIKLVILVVGLEHLLIGLRALIGYIIPDQSKWVQIALARDAYLLRTKALSQQVRGGKHKHE